MIKTDMDRNWSKLTPEELEIVRGDPRIAPHDHPEPMNYEAVMHLGTGDLKRQFITHAEAAAWREGVADLAASAGILIPAGEVRQLPGAHRY